MSEQLRDIWHRHQDTRSPWLWNAGFIRQADEPQVGPADESGVPWECTTVSLRWLSVRLEMGHYTKASRKPRKMNPGSLRPCQQARATLQLLDKNEVTKSMNTNFLMGDPFIKQNEPPSRMAQLFR